MKHLKPFIIGLVIGLCMPAAQAFGSMVIDLSENSVHNYYKGCIVAGLLSFYGDKLTPEQLSNFIKKYERAI